MNFNRKREAVFMNNFEKWLMNPSISKKFMITPIIVSFCKKNLTSADIRSFIITGMKIIHLRMSHLTKSDMILMINKIRDATEWYCNINHIHYWPITIALDIPSSVIRTGLLKHAINETINLVEDSILKLTADPQFWHACDWDTIYIDDPYTIINIPIGTEITICFKILLVVIDIIDQQSLRCKVLRGGAMGNLEFVCIRGVKHVKPPLSDIDLELIELAMQYKLDIIIINAIQTADVFKDVKRIFRRARVSPPLLIGTICEVEGLNNIDDIIKGADGIILARDFLSHEIDNKLKMVTIQLCLSAKCRQAGIPFYISGNVLERTLQTGKIVGSDLDDITNGVLQYGGFVLTDYKNPRLVVEALEHMEETCKFVEPLTYKIGEVSNFVKKSSLPATTADSCVSACAVLAKASGSVAIIVNSVSGKTALSVSQMSPGVIVITVTRSETVAKQLQIHRAIVPMIYERTSKPDWNEEMGDRITFAVNNGVALEILKVEDRYVAFTKSLPSSAYNDNISIWAVHEERTQIKGMRPTCNGAKKYSNFPKKIDSFIS